MDNTEARITVDIGNSFIKFGLFTVLSYKTSFPEPVSVCVETTSVFSDLSHWLIEQGGRFRRFSWLISSVNEKRTASLRHWIERHRPWDPVQTVLRQDIPLVLRYDYLEKLGIDRIVAAFAAQKLLQRSGPILIVDIGTATTIDLLDPDGRFLGGSIFPGPQISSQVLFERTERLPHTGWSRPLPLSLVSQNIPSSDDPSKSEPDYPATNTEDGIRCGICSSLIGAVFSSYLNSMHLLFHKTNNQSEFLCAENTSGKNPSENHQFNHISRVKTDTPRTDSPNTKADGPDVNAINPNSDLIDNNDNINNDNINIVSNDCPFDMDAKNSDRSPKDTPLETNRNSNIKINVSQNTDNKPDRTIPIVIAERGARLIEKPLSDLFSQAEDLFGPFAKPEIVTCSYLILSGLAALFHNIEN